MSPESCTVRADRRAASLWTVLALLLVAVTGWLVADASLDVAAVVGLALALGLLGWFGAQALVPSWFEVTCDGTGLHARALWARVDVPWSDVHLVRVRQVAGEPVLQVHHRAGGTPPSGLLLPVGVDLEALHASLAAHLGQPEPTT
ncbi:MAG: hypothetical protein ACLGIR_00665 [Actinomycetes bacterium]